MRSVLRHLCSLKPLHFIANRATLPALVQLTSRDELNETSQKIVIWGAQGISQRLKLILGKGAQDLPVGMIKSIRQAPPPMPATQSTTIFPCKPDDQGKEDGKESIPITVSFRLLNPSLLAYRAEPSSIQTDSCTESLPRSITRFGSALSATRDQIVSLRNYRKLYAG